MKKLALVLGSLLVVGTAVSAKEVMPAPVAAPEKIVEIVEKPVIIYKDRDVTPAWRPNGSIIIDTRTFGEIEGHRKDNGDLQKDKDGKVIPGSDSDWKGANYKSQIRTTATVNFTPNQTLKIYNRHDFNWKRNADDNKEPTTNVESYLQHTYKFGKLGSSNVEARLESRFGYKGGKTEKFVQLRPVFAFAKVFPKGEYFSVDTLDIAPNWRYTWNANDNYNNQYGLYVDAIFKLPLHTSLEIELDKAFNYKKVNPMEANKDKDLSTRKGGMTVTLSNTYPIYKAGKHTFSTYLAAEYDTSWSYSKNELGTKRSSGKIERMGGYTVELIPGLFYNYKATDNVSLDARIYGHYINRTSELHGARHWRWQPEFRLGMKVAF